MKYLIFILVCLLAFVGCHSDFNGVSVNCSVTNIVASVSIPNGGVEISCPGSNPAILLNGTNGLNGLDATQIRTVQFCPGTTVYPSTFNEVGFCINNQLWGVYSLNNGFLTQIVPGAYSSNAIGSSCNFVVLPNCVIQN